MENFTSRHLQTYYFKYLTESSNRAPNLFSSSTGFSLRLPARFVCNKIVTFACSVALLIVLQTTRMKSSALSPSVSVVVHEKSAIRGEGVGPTRDGKYHNFFLVYYISLSWSPSFSVAVHKISVCEASRRSWQAVKQSTQNLSWGGLGWFCKISRCINTQRDTYSNTDPKNCNKVNLYNYLFHWRASTGS